MKFLTFLPLAALATALVVVDEELLQRIPVEASSKSPFDKLPSKISIISGVEEAYTDVIKHAENVIDKAFNAASEDVESCHSSMTSFDVKSWLADEVAPEEDADSEDHPKGPPHHKKPHHGKPHHGPKSNKTIYELISTSKYTTKLAKLIDEYSDLVDLLNGTSANYTIFAPTDAAFKKIPHHHKKPSKQLIRNILGYHVSPYFYPAGRLLATHTIPTTYREQQLGGEPQRLRVGFSVFQGLNINFRSKIVAADIFASNGVIHGVNSLILPAPPVWKIIALLPGEFSTLQLALVKTGLADGLENGPHLGGTLFAPSNRAFKALGPKVNGFLFSKYGEKYLKALLKYHVVANQTLYSDAFYKAKDASDTVDADDIPKGRSHVDLPTLLDGKSLSIDIARFGGFITIRINGFSTVVIQDGIASDGVIQVPGHVLIPPKKHGGHSYQGEELAVEDLKERLEEYIDEKKGWFGLDFDL